jgi:hypothetical protein
VSKILVLYYSAYGHIEKIAEAVAEGAGAVPGTQGNDTIATGFSRSIHLHRIQRLGGRVARPYAPPVIGPMTPHHTPGSSRKRTFRA